MDQSLSLDTYRLLGRSGLRVSPLALGTMTFGSNCGWCAGEDEARRIFDTYVDRGGNFIDTANQYTEGSSERLIGKFAQGKRDRLIIGTKYTMALRPADPNSGGNHRKSMVQSVAMSLQRLATDYIDLLYVHYWDGTTAADEILRAMEDLVRAGKVLYLGISDSPAWQAARMQTIADLRGWSPLIALEVEYSLVERTVERELIPMAAQLGLGVIAWSPLGSGILTGKYTRRDLEASDQAPAGSRKAVLAEYGMLSERKLAIAEVVRQVAAEMGRSPSQVALAWTLLNRAVISPIVGSRTLEQFRDNLGALDIRLTPAQRTRLDEASAVEPCFPYDFLARLSRLGELFGGAKIVAPDSWRAPR